MLSKRKLLVSSAGLAGVLGVGVGLGGMLCMTQYASAANLAADNASNYISGGSKPYSFQNVGGVSTNTSEPNEGYGFGAWTIISNLASGVGGHTGVISDSPYGSPAITTVGTTPDDSQTSSPNTNAVFGTGTYGGNTTQASQFDWYRAFTGGALSSGQTFSFSEAGYNGGSLNSVVADTSYSRGWPEAGFSMETAAPNLTAGTAGGYGAPSINDSSAAVQIYFNNLGTTNPPLEFVITDATGTHFPANSSALPSLPGGSTFSFTVGAGNTYTFNVLPPSGGSPLFTYSGTYVGNIVGANIFAQEGNDVYFNSLAITATPEPAPLGLFVMAGIGGLMLIRCRRMAAVV